MSVPHQAVVLCAGEGLRLRPHTAHCPKPLLPLVNAPILEHLLVGLARAGVRRVALNAFHLAEQLQTWAAQARIPGLSLHVRVEPVLLGTGGGLANLADWVEPGPLLVLTGDVTADFDYHALAGRHRESGAEATMLLCPHADVERYGAVHHDAEGWITDIAGLCGRPAARGARSGPGSHGLHGAPGAVNASVHVFEWRFLARLPAGHGCLVRQGYVPALLDGARCAAAFHAGPWADLGTPADLVQAQVDALAGTLPVAPALLARGGRRDGARRLVHPKADVAADAILDGGTVVGPRAAIGPGARLTGCLVLADARVPAHVSCRGLLIDPAAGLPAGSAATGAPDSADERTAQRAP
jgi:mannose-1-phosphate guanylyltransferase